MDNTSVEMMQQGNVLDDAAQAPEEPQGEAFSSLMEEEQPQETQPEQGLETPAKEPGWVRKRIDQAIARERRAWEAEQEQKLAPLYESMYDRQAQELVSSGEFKSLERAKEYVRMKHGAVSIPESEPQPQASGSKADSVDPVMKARADLLSQQARKIKENSGIDVLAAFNANPNIQQKLASGEWDFYDVADALRQNQRIPPSPVRTPNGMGFSSVNIQNMDEKQWRKLQENLAGGRKYDMRK